MKPVLATLLFTAFLMSTLSAQVDGRELLEQGRQAAREGNYEQAVEAFDAFRDRLTAMILEFQAVREEIVDDLANTAHHHILEMDYPAAAEKLQTAAHFTIATPAFLQATQEVAFFWTEAGKLQQAATFLQITQFAAVGENRAELHAFLTQMDPGYYQTLEQRYYGDMQPITGGNFKYQKFREISKMEGVDAEVGNFQIARTEVTFWQYSLFCAAKGRNIFEKIEPSWGNEGHDPIINVSWYDAVEYCNWLSDLRGLTPAYRIDSLQRDPLNRNDYDEVKWLVRPVPGANGYRLPTELEWEYAARGGAGGHEWAGTNDEMLLGQFAWFGENSSRTHPVATKAPNALGLHDMTGNVAEWCWDWGEELLDLPAVVDKAYSGLPEGARRVIRGGGWHSVPYACFVAYRFYVGPDLRGKLIGFRVARTP